ncbi:MAG: PAS domain S-box protein [Pseudomonadota bacterium]
MDLKGQSWLAENTDVVLDAVVDAIITIDVRGQMLSVNRATLEMFGYAEDQLVGQPVSMLMPEPYRSQHQSYVDSYTQGGEAKIIGIGRELQALRQDGSVFPIYLAVSKISAQEGMYFVGIIRDLSEQKRAQDVLLEQRDRLAQVGRLSTMGEMTASIAHEINQPLTAISMYAQACIRLLEKSEVRSDKILEAVRKLNDQSLRAGAVIERIQRFVQNVGGQREFVDLNTLILDLRHLVVGDARLHGIELEFDLSPLNPQVFCDPVQVQQVGINLIRNAIDAMYEIDCRHGGEIRVISTVIDAGLNTTGGKNGANRYAQVLVVDSGPGVAVDQAGKIFTAFHTTKSNGMGMGLSICRSIIEEHGGVLSFRNNAEVGACFYFQIPLAQNDE